LIVGGWGLLSIMNTMRTPSWSMITRMKIFASQRRILTVFVI
jgi:hypothetical protein